MPEIHIFKCSQWEFSLKEVKEKEDLGEKRGKIGGGVARGRVITGCKGHKRSSCCR